MSAAQVFDCFYLDLGKGVHDFSTDQLKIALCDVAPDLAADVGLADLTEISYTYASSLNVTTTSWSQASGVAKLVCQDLLVDASGGPVGPFRYVVLYNDTSAGKSLIAMWDKGSEVTISDGTNSNLDFTDTAQVVFQLG